MTETYDQHGARLETSYMSAIDDMLAAIDAYIAAIAADDREATGGARDRARRAWALYGELIINRADHRTAHMLLDQLRHVEAMLTDVRASQHAAQAQRQEILDRLNRQEAGS